MKKLQIPILLIILLFSACGTGHPESSTEFVIKNNSLHKVELKIFNASLPNLNPLDVEILLDIDSDKSYTYTYDGENEWYSSPFGGTSDSTYIVFNNQKQLKFLRDALHPRNIINIDSWEGEKLSNTYYKYTYTITSEDYEMAEEIK